MLLQPDADGMTGRPQVAADMQVQNLQKHLHWEHVPRQEPRDRLDFDRMHTGIDKAWSTERQHAMLAARRTVQPALQLGVAVSYAEHWAGWPGKQLYGAVGTCTVLSMLLPTDLRSCTGTGSQHNQPAEKCCSKAISHKVLAMSAVPVVLHSLELTMTLAYGMHSRRKRMFERCRQATQQSTKKETRRVWSWSISV
jgi:hypothetical protein